MSRFFRTFEGTALHLVYLESRQTKAREEDHLAESDTPKARLGKVIQIDEGQLKDELGSLVRESVEETLNTMLGAEADCRN